MYKKFDELFIDETKYGTKIKTDQYLSEGKYPIVDQGQKKISGYTDIEDGIFKEVPAIIFGDHTRLIKYIDAPFFIGADGVKIIRSRLKEINYKYLYYALLNVSIPNTGYNRHFKWLKETKIYYPDSEKQKYIVEVLDKISLIIEKKNKQIEQWDILLKSLFIEMFGDPVENPKKWDIIQLHDRCDIVTGNTPAREKSEYYGNYIEWIKSDNINTDDMYLTVAEEYLSKKGLLVGRCVEAGSILMTCIAGSIGCIGNVGVANRKVAFNQQINAIVPNKDSNIFIYWLMVLSKKYIQGTVNMSLKGILSKGKLSELYFPFPPIELQHKFEKNAIVIDKSKYSSFSHLSA